MWKKQVHGGDRRVVLERVLGERLLDVDPRVVDQAVDPPEPIERLLDHAPGGVGFGDVTLHREEVRLVGGADRTRGADDGVSRTAQRGRDACADAAVGTGDDRHLLWLRRAHATR
jgi:hypothetical protein